MNDKTKAWIDEGGLGVSTTVSSKVEEVDGRTFITLGGTTTVQQIAVKRNGRTTIQLREVARPLPPPGGPLGDALREAIATRWRGMRSARRNKSQGTIAVFAIQNIAGEEVEADAVTKAHLRAVVAGWLAAGTLPATAVARLNCLSAIGVNVKGCRPKVPRPLKWWLDTANEAKIVKALISTGKSRERRVALLIRWTALTGLRIEESLRLTWADIRKGERPGTTAITVPGLKTALSQATLPLSARAAPLLHLARKEHGREPVPSDLVFGLVYWEAQRVWRRHRRVFGLADPAVATLKALRRSAARNLHAERGMPLDVVRHMLRHESIQTTLGYLRLTGGYNEEEMARWL